MILGFLLTRQKRGPAPHFNSRDKNLYKKGAEIPYPFTDVWVVTLGEFSGKELHPKARKHQHQCEEQDGDLCVCVRERERERERETER